MRRGNLGVFALIAGLMLGASGMSFANGSFAVPMAMAAGPQGKICTGPGIIPGTVVVVPCPPSPSPLNDGLGDPPAQQDKCAGERAILAMAESAAGQAEQAVVAAEGAYEAAKAAWERSTIARTQAEGQVPLAESTLAAAQRALAKANADYHAAVAAARHFPPWPHEQAKIDAAASVQTAAIAAETAAQNALQAAKDAVVTAKQTEAQAAQNWSNASGELTNARSARSTALTKLAAAQRALHECETRPKPIPNSNAA